MVDFLFSKASIEIKDNLNKLTENSKLLDELHNNLKKVL